MYPENCYADENATYDDDEFFPYPEYFYEEDDLKFDDKIWVPRVVDGEPAKLGEIPYQVLKVSVNDVEW